MTEIFLTLTNLAFGISILTYFYLKEIKQRNDARDDVRELHEFYKETIVSTNEYNKEREVSKDALLSETFTSYLKHIQSLEKLAIPKAPLPITRDMVENFMTPMPNDIEKTDTEDEQTDFSEMLRKVPITPETKVSFESEANPIEEEIIE